MITYAIEFVFCAFAVHTAIHFASGLVSLWNSEKSAPASVSKCNEWNEERLDEIQEIRKPQPQTVMVDAVVPFVRSAKSTTEPVKVADLLKDQSIRQLKKIASVCKLPRYCNDSKNRLIARLLSEVDSARLQEVVAG